MCSDAKYIEEGSYRQRCIILFEKGMGEAERRGSHKCINLI